MVNLPDNITIITLKRLLLSLPLAKHSNVWSG